MSEPKLEHMNFRNAACNELGRKVARIGEFNENEFIIGALIRIAIATERIADLLDPDVRAEKAKEKLDLESRKQESEEARRWRDKLRNRLRPIILRATKGLPDKVIDKLVWQVFTPTRYAWDGEVRWSRARGRVIDRVRDQLSKRYETEEELLELQGVGPKTAKKILADLAATKAQEELKSCQQ